jgi:hypothetical protein
MDLGEKIKESLEKEVVLLVVVYWPCQLDSEEGERGGLVNNNREKGNKDRSKARETDSAMRNEWPVSVCD